jgi:hypothetical protein
MLPAGQRVQAERHRRQGSSPSVQVGGLEHRRPIRLDGLSTGSSGEGAERYGAYVLIVKPTIASSVVTGDASQSLQSDSRLPSRPSHQMLQVARLENPTWGGRRRVEKLVGFCVVVSGSAHGLFTQQHFQEWWGFSRTLPCAPWPSQPRRASDHAGRGHFELECARHAQPRSAASVHWRISSYPP